MGGGVLTLVCAMGGEQKEGEPVGSPSLSVLVVVGEGVNHLALMADQLDQLPVTVHRVKVLLVLAVVAEVLDSLGDVVAHDYLSVREAVPP